MGLIQIFLQAFLVGLSGAVAPGPMLTYNIQLSYKKGFWVGPKLVLGHAILEAILVLGLILGLGSFIRLPLTRICLGFLGGILLAWMSFDLIVSESRKGLAGAEEAATISTNTTVSAATLNPVLAGFVVSLTNPYWSLWWSMIGLTLITQSFSQGWVGVTVFFCGHILADLGWYSFISVAVSKGRRFISEQLYRWLLIGCGVILAFMALAFIYDALNLCGVSKWLFEQTTDLFLRMRKLV